MGLIMLYLVKNSKYADVLRVDKKGLLNFAKWMAIITIFRIVVLRLLSPPGALESVRELTHMLPWQVTFGVFWEDMCHTVPLVILARMMAKKKWYKWISPALLVLVMFAFGSGHVYQGMLPAVALSFYIPVTMKLGKKYGFGTVMLCHMAYDLITLVSLRWIAG